LEIELEEDEPEVNKELVGLIEELGEKGRA
jgi:hypothetical protein